MANAIYLFAHVSCFERLGNRTKILENRLTTLSIQFVSICYVILLMFHFYFYWCVILQRQPFRGGSGRAKPFLMRNLLQLSLMQARAAPRCPCTAHGAENLVHGLKCDIQDSWLLARQIEPPGGLRSLIWYWASWPGGIWRCLREWGTPPLPEEPVPSPLPPPLSLFWMIGCGWEAELRRLFHLSWYSLKSCRENINTATLHVWS